MAIASTASTAVLAGLVVGLDVVMVYSFAESETSDNVSRVSVSQAIVRESHRPGFAMFRKECA
jgi:hypothetical protein